MLWLLAGYPIGIDTISVTSGQQSSYACHACQDSGNPETAGSMRTVRALPVVDKTVCHMTAGVVSRIEVTSYAHSSTELLGVQIDAAINSGNSGGLQGAGSQAINAVLARDPIHDTVKSDGPGTWLTLARS